MDFGIVGTGMIGEFHARAISEMEGSRLVACVDADESRARAFAARWSVAPYSDIGSFLTHPGLDVVNVCTPSGAHLEPALAAAAAGKHLIVEKPLEIDVERCDRMIDAADKAGIQLCGVFPSRFHEAPRVLKDAVDAGRFGRITMGNAYVKWWRDQEYYDGSAWKGTRALDGGGALMNQSIHAIDLLQWFMGPVEEITAMTATIGHEHVEVEDCAAAAIRFSSGALGVIQGTTAAWPGFLKRLEVSGLRGSAVIEEESIVFWRFREEQASDPEILGRLSSGTHTGGGSADPAAIGHHGHRRQFEDFVSAVRGGGKPLVDGVEARKAVQIIRGIYRSAETGAPVRLGP